MTSPKKILNDYGQVRWEIRTYVGIGAKRKQIRRRFKTEREAKAELTRITHEQNEGTYVHPDKTMTVEKLVERWAQAKAGSHKESSALHYVNSFVRLIEEYGEVPVMNLTDKHLMKLRDDMVSGASRRVGSAHKPMEATSVNAMLGAIWGLLNYGMTIRVLAHNVADKALVPRVKDRRTEEDPKRSSWGGDELRKFRVATADSDLCGSWALTAQGLRRGEVLGLKWKDIDQEARSVKIERTRTYVNGVDVVGPPKSKDSKRILKNVSPAAMEALQRQRARQVQYGFGREDDWVTAYTGPPVPRQQRRGRGFLAQIPGEAIRTEWYSDELQRIAKEVGLPAVVLHGVRHAVATTMKARGVSLPDIAKWLGQSPNSLAVTLGYIHASDTQSDLIRAALED